MKNKKQINTSPIANSNELSNLMKIIIAVTIIFIIFYAITTLVTKKKEDEKEATNVEATVQYNKILAGTILNQPEEEYYVLVEFEDNNYNSLYEYYLSLYSAKDKSLHYYTVDMSDSFNQQYKSDKSDLSKEKIGDIKFNTTTLLKIKQAKIIESYQNKNEITSKLDKIIK